MRHGHAGVLQHGREGAVEPTARNTTGKSRLVTVVVTTLTTGAGVAPAAAGVAAGAAVAGAEADGAEAAGVAGAEDLSASVAAFLEQATKPQDRQTLATVDKAIRAGKRAAKFMNLSR